MMRVYGNGERRIDDAASKFRRLTRVVGTAARVPRSAATEPER